MNGSSEGPRGRLSARFSFRWAAILVLAASLGAGVCDPGDITIVPEVQGSFSFEGGLDGWTAAASPHLSAGVDWSAAPESGVSTSGGSSLRLEITDGTASGAVWIERAFVLTPEEAYRVDLSAQLGELGPVGVAWGGVLDISDRPLSARGGAPGGGPNVGGTATGPAVEWTPWTQSVNYDTGTDQDTVWVAVGLAARSTDARRYYLDALELVFTRR